MQNRAVAAAAAAAAAVAAYEVGATFADPRDAANAGLAGPLTGSLPSIDVGYLAPHVEPSMFAPQASSAMHPDHPSVECAFDDDGSSVDSKPHQASARRREPSAASAGDAAPPRGMDEEDDEDEDDEEAEAEADAKPARAGRRAVGRAMRTVVPTSPAAGDGGRGSEPKPKKPAASSGRRKAAGGTRKRRNLPPEATKILKDWLLSPEHIEHPYPSDAEKQDLAERTGLTLRQLNNWFLNARKRFWRPLLKEQGHDLSDFGPHRKRA